MAGFDELIVREYFELHGFLVRQVRKYAVQARKKLDEEEIDLLVYNPGYSAEGTRAPNFLIFGSELPHIHRAVIAVKAWHTAQRFSPRILQSSDEILKFLDKNVLKIVDQMFQDRPKDLLPGSTSDPLLKILVLPGLPTSEPHRSEAIDLLRERGVDGIISFRSMLWDLIQKVEANRNYSKSDLLQILRILKNYDLIKDPQLGLFK
ncbi:MAG: hypothetical protein Q7P63_07815 [Verrucomicrobiota bacterium JB022]|nr:hypothetical protein [Verrucomicrobiota bacterium JB022]